MFVILVYDVGVKRVAKVLKLVRRYLVHIQKSVFEGELTEAKLERLKEELAEIIQPAYDTVVIYTFDSLKYSEKHSLGRQFEDLDIL